MRRSDSCCRENCSWLESRVSIIRSKYSSNIILIKWKGPKIKKTLYDFKKNLNCKLTKVKFLSV